jgi:mannose-6-phosphate isomerase
MALRQLGHKFVHRVWGRLDLAPLFQNPRAERIGEIWLETVPGLPLLIKFLFTSEKLSVQVHPKDDYAQRHGHPRGKTEMWHILSAEPGAKIAAGFVRKLSPEEMRVAAESGEIMDLLAWHDARPGDTFFLNAGTVHAIGEGITLCEIQQESDVTYRLFDYGRPRELHLDHGMAVSDLGPADVRSKAREGVLVSCPEFRTERISVEGSKLLTPERPEVWIVIEGSGTIGGLSADAGTAWYTDAGPAQEIAGRLTLLRTTH